MQGCVSMLAEPVSARPASKPTGDEMTDLRETGLHLSAQEQQDRMRRASAAEMQAETVRQMRASQSAGVVSVAGSAASAAASPMIAIVAGFVALVAIFG